MEFKELTPASIDYAISGASDGPVCAAFPIYPPDAPGMPPPGPNFLAAAEALATVRDPGTPNVKGTVGWFVRLLYFNALYNPEFTLPVEVARTQMPLRLIPGHLWDGPVTGPLRPETTDPIVMVVGKLPSKDELAESRNFVGPTSTFFRTALAEAGIAGDVVCNWYVSNLVRWINMDPKGGALPAKWIKDCLPILHQELRLVKPDYILCLGAEAAKAITGETLSSLAGRVVEIQFPLNEVNEPELLHTTKVMALTHPAAVYRNTAQYPGYVESLRSFRRLIDTGKARLTEDQIELRYIRTERELSELVDEVLSQPGLKKIAVDAEWHGSHPGEPGAYVRTVQISHRSKFGAVIILAEQGGESAFYPGQEAAVRQLQRLLDRPDVQLIGHFFQADMPWLGWLGVPLWHRYKAPQYVEHMRHGDYAGGFATDLAIHAVDETGDFKLELLCVRYCNAPRWDSDLLKWRKSYCSEHDLTEEELEGYGECPGEVLYPYGGYDAAYTWMLADVLSRQDGLLDRDRYGLDSWVPFHRSMRAFPAFFEMHLTGMRVDRERVIELTEMYKALKVRLVEDLRREINWPGFNPGSVQQCKELLFGVKLNGKVGPDGSPITVRPEGAVSLTLTPVKTTQGQPWARIVSRGEEDKHAPSTDKEVLGILSAESPIVAQLRDIRFIEQITKSVLRPPESDKNGEYVFDEQGKHIYTGGLIKYICRDQRVRTTFLQTKETGRAASKRPALQNWSNKRECYDRQTEFLTRRGWVKGEDLRDDDLFAQYDPAIGEIEFVRSSRIVRYAYKGKMVRIKNRSADLLVTPDHRCLVRAKATGKFAEHTAGKLPLTGHHIVAGSYFGGSEQLSEGEVIFLAAVQADGHWVNNRHLEFGFRKRRKFDRLTKALKLLKAPYSVMASSRGDLRVRVPYVPNCALMDKIRSLLVDGKLFAPGLLHRLDWHTRKQLAEEVFLWDGCSTFGNSYYSSGIQQNRDFVQSLFATVGWRSIVDEEAGKVYCRSSRLDYVDIEQAKRTEEDYDDYVYCATVPSSWLVVRRNGRVSVSGNTDYSRIAGDDYKYPLRSVFISEYDAVAPKEKTVIIGSDYSGAELVVQAAYARDKLMIEHCQRAALKDGNPEQYDIHSNIATLAFKLQCPPTKAGLRAAGKKHLRIAAKAVIFGTGYGQGADSCARKCNEELKRSEQITTEDAQAIIDTIFTLYSGIPPFQAACRARVTNPCWMRNAKGRLRRFVPTDDRQALGELEREALNFLMQSMVAEAVNDAMDNLVTHPRKEQLGYRMALQLHDAIYLEVPVRSVDEVYHEILPECMIDRVSFRAADLDGKPYKDSPDYRFTIDTHVYHRWSTDTTEADCDSLGIKREYAHVGED